LVSSLARRPAADRQAIVWSYGNRDEIRFRRIKDDLHQFGGLQGSQIGGDEAHFGRVFLATGGRGYLYGDPND